MNQIIVVTSNEYESIKDQINTTDTFLVEIEGNTIQTTNQLFDIMEQKYDLINIHNYDNKKNKLIGI